MDQISETNAATPVPTSLDRWVRATDLPMLLLALASIPLLVLETHGSVGVRASAVAFSWMIWAAFAGDLAIRLVLVGSHRWRYLARNWFDVAIVPFLRPLRAFRSARVLRLARSLRVVGFLGRFWSGATRLWEGMHGRLVGVAVLVIVVSGAVATWIVERHADGPIQNLDDSIWWALTTVTTVGYGDTYPVTSEGRGVAVFLMLAGIAVFGVVSANLAAIFIRTGPEASSEVELREEIASLSAKIDSLSALLQAAHPMPAEAAQPEH